MGEVALSEEVAVQEDSPRLYVKPSLDAITKRGSKVSWSQYKKFRDCPASWFYEDFAVPVERREHVIRDNNTLAGTIIQRLWESAVNEEILGSPGAVGWLEQQTEPLFHAIAWPIDKQFERSPEEWRGYFRKDEGGRQYLLSVSRAHALDERLFTNLQPKFVEEVSFIKQFRSAGGFIEKVRKLHEPVYRVLLGMGVQFDRLRSELFASGTLGRADIRGGIDFLYNPAGPFRHLREISSGYILFDGKWSVHPGVTREQLDFYATALFVAYRAVPKVLGFLDWQRAKFSWHQFDLGAVDRVRRSVEMQDVTREHVQNELRSRAGAGEQVVGLSDMGSLPMRPGKYCTYCRALTECPEAIRSGYAKKTAEAGAPAAPVKGDFD